MSMIASFTARRNITLALGIIGATVVAFVIHVKYGNFVYGVVAKSMEGVEMAQPPYGPMVTAIAGITSVLPILGLFLIFSMLYDKVPCKSPLGKGVFFGLLYLLSEGELIRMPLMNALIGNPFGVVLLQASAAIAPRLIVAIILSFVVSYSRRAA